MPDAPTPPSPYVEITFRWHTGRVDVITLTAGQVAYLLENVKDLELPGETAEQHTAFQ